MALTLPRNFFYGAIVFTFMLTGIVYVLGLISADTPTGEPSLMSESQVKYLNDSFYPENLTSNINELETKLRKITPSQKWGVASLVSLPVAFMETAWAAVGFVITSFGFMDSSIRGMSAVIGIPAWVPAVIILLIVIFFVFSILTVLFGKDI